MPRVYCLLAATCLVLSSGCDQYEKPSPVAIAAPPSLADLPLVAHPEYEHWSKFPVGTKVIRKDTLASSEGEAFLHTTLQLVASSDSGVTIETQSSIERNGVRQDSDLNTVEYPAQFRLPPGMAIEQFQLPSQKAQRKEDQKIVVVGNEYIAKVYTFQEQSEAGPVDVTLWRSNEIPGRQAKKEIVSREGLMLTTSSVVEIDLP